MVDTPSEEIVPSDEEINGSPMSYFNDKTIGFREIVLRQIETCRVEWSREMTRGGPRNVFSRELNDYISVNIPDQRRVCQQVTQALYDLLLYYFDDEINKALKEIEKNVNELYKKYFDAYAAAETWEPYKQAAQRTQVIQTGEDSSVGFSYQQQYEDEVVTYWRQIYQELIKLFKRANELSKRKAADYK